MSDEISALRKENADRRAKLKPYLEAFDGWSDGQKSYMLGVIQLLGQDGSREQGYRELYELAKAGVAAYDGDTPDEPEEENEMSDVNPTLDDEFQKRVEAAVNERMKEREKELEAQLERDRTNIQIDAEARALGYEPGTSAFAQLMHHAAHLEGGAELSIQESLQAAHNKVLDDIGTLLGTSPELESELEPETLPAPEPEPEAPRFARTAQAGGAGGPVEHPDEQEPGDWADARVAFENFLDAADQPAQ